jgi:hypothetical protein
MTAHPPVGDRHLRRRITERCSVRGAIGFLDAAKGALAMDRQDFLLYADDRKMRTSM